ncbi:cytochrome P450 [Dendrothele bispora CBS 962.96]|uniref:Cytochrome P450 n=1 Tax=Dendrothele bispora (strain CBS 962.96) TaxID=1314807 RepID=A0A4S8LY46_DENBC|nr:cytochrome P450 [Dendrothele bispora CBS 962.96]
MIPLLLLFALVVVVAVRVFRAPRTPSIPLPPGPKPVPILGNILDLTPKELWLRATSWSKHYGELVYLHVFGQPLIFINSPAALSALLDGRGALYADKPHLTMVNDLCGCENMVAFTGYGPQSKRQRRLMNMAFSTTRIPAYHPLIERETHLFLKRLISIPKDAEGNQLTPEQAQVNHIPLIRRYAGQLTLSVIYGYQAEEHNDPFLNLAEECVDILSNKIASGGGIWPVDIIPVLRHLPEWMPGAGFLKKAREWKAKMNEFVDEPYQWVKECMKNNTHQPSFCSTLLEDQEFNPAAAAAAAVASSGSSRPRAYSKVSSSSVIKVTPDISQFEFDLKWTANSMYSASGDTTITTLQHFLMAMLLHPEVLEKAQAEIDSVVGSDRLPTFSDRPNLKYCEAVMSEVWRWGVVVPLNLPHRLTEDDIYTPAPCPANPNPVPVLLPKGSIVFGNIWSVMRSEELFDRPDEFRPERYLLSPEETALLSTPASTSDDETTKTARENLLKQRKIRDPRTWVFGFGRRQCPGRNLVEDSIWLVLVCLMASMNITRPLSENGESELKGFWPSTVASSSSSSSEKSERPLPAYMANGARLGAGEDLYALTSSSSNTFKGQGKVSPLGTVEGIRFDNSVFRQPTTFRVDIRPRSEAALGLVLGEGDD